MSIVTLEKLKAIKKQLLLGNIKLVMANGCFDIIHMGHVQLLQEARKLGDTLLVAINSDASVKRLKGDDRPINNQFDRASILDCFEFVDMVTVFDEETPIKLIEELHPDVLVKGGDYAPNEVIGKELVESYGGKIIILPYIQNYSTSFVIQKIKEI